MLNHNYNKDSGFQIVEVLSIKHSFTLFLRDTKYPVNKNGGIHSKSLNDN